MVKEITLVRTVDATLERVWQAWTDPKQLMQWWGPNAVTIPTAEVDLRVGGTFYIVMEAGAEMGPYKGTLWPMRAQFTEVVPNSKLSYTATAWTEGNNVDSMIEQTTDVTFTEENGKTTIMVVAAILKTGPAAGAAVQGMEYGFNQQLDKMVEFLNASK